MSVTMMLEKGKILGINGLGRIGKLLIWDLVERKEFSELVVNVGRHVGLSLEAITSIIERDSTYGWLHHYLFGSRTARVIEGMDEKNGSMVINGIKTTFLRQNRNPKDIEWRDRGVSLVIDATGAFTDPTLPADVSSGSLRGHLAAGAKKVILSAPFKIKDKSKTMPPDSVTTVLGINDSAYDPRRHVLISNASCTTTGLAYMVKPLLDYFGLEKILLASMTTVHAITGSQQVLDHAPKAGSSDLRKSRSVLNNIILTSTGAAKALSLVIPEMKQIGFLAESVRVPITTGSLIILVLALQDKNNAERIDGALINGIYQNAAKHHSESRLVFSNDQNVSSDIIGARAAVIIEGQETHTRTSLMHIKHDDKFIEIALTQAVIYGWYDNEMGSYVHMLGDQAVSVSNSMR